MLPREQLDKREHSPQLDIKQSKRLPSFLACKGDSGIISDVQDFMSAFPDNQTGNTTR